MRRTFKYRLYPTKEQKKHIRFTLERCRLLYNRLLEECILAYKSERKSISYYEQANTFNDSGETYSQQDLLLPDPC